MEENRENGMPRGGETPVGGTSVGGSAGGPVYEERPATARRPRNFWKAGLFLVIVGLAMGGAGYAMGGRGSLTFDRNGLHVNSPSEDAGVYIGEFDLPAFDRVDIESSSSVIEFKEGAGYGVEMNMPEAFQAEWSLEDGELKIGKHDGDGKFSAQIMNFDFDFDDYYIRVTYPAGAAFESVKLDSSSGGIDAVISNANEADVHSSSGGTFLTVGEVGSLSVKSSSGGIELTGGEGFIHEADIKNSSGSLTITGGKWTDLEVESSSGGVEIEAELRGETDVKSSSGSVSVYAQTDGEYGYDIDRSSGSVTVNGDRYEGDVEHNTDSDNMFKIKSSSGSIILEVNN